MWHGTYMPNGIKPFPNEIWAGKGGLLWKLWDFIVEEDILLAPSVDNSEMIQILLWVT